MVEADAPGHVLLDGRIDEALDVLGESRIAEVVLLHAKEPACERRGGTSPGRRPCFEGCDHRLKLKLKLVFWPSLQLPQRCRQVVAADDLADPAGVGAHADLRLAHLVAFIGGLVITHRTEQREPVHLERSVSAQIRGAAAVVSAA